MGDREGQRYFKLTPKGRPPKVHMEWPAEEKPWYIRYAYDWVLLLIAIPLLILRVSVNNDGWVAICLEVILIGIFFMWLVTLPSSEYEKMH